MFPCCLAALDAYVFLRDNKAFEEETHKILARTVSAALQCESSFTGPPPYAAWMQCHLVQRPVAWLYLTAGAACTSSGNAVLHLVLQHTPQQSCLYYAHTDAACVVLSTSVFRLCGEP